VQTGQEPTYTVTVTNGGPDTAIGVTVTDTPAVTMRLISAKAHTGACDHKFPTDATPRRRRCLPAASIAGAVGAESAISAGKENVADRSRSASTLGIPTGRITAGAA
jgi:uncharacterized repeat protein (TIGR01451 family)